LVDVADDRVDDGMLCDDGDDLHFGAALTQEWVDLEDLADEASPGSSARHGVFLYVMFCAKGSGL